jgi:glutathione synthase/RimK-type ligase-like ATP-grasp enzyme
LRRGGRFYTIRRPENLMRKKRIALVFGMEDTFPWALIDAINARGGDAVEAMPAEISYLKCAAASGVQIVNNPIWWSADDKFFDNLVAKSVNVAVPKTVLLPHKDYPPSTEAKSFRNMRWVNWDEVFAYLGFPIFMKPAYGGGWKDVYKCDNQQEFFAAYDQTRDLAMMAQEAIEFDRYYRCYVLGRNRVHIMHYDPKQPHHLRYVKNPPPMEPEFEARIRRDAIALCDALGYDMNTVEFAVRDGVPIAIDFMNCARSAKRISNGWSRTWPKR